MGSRADSDVAISKDVEVHIGHKRAGVDSPSSIQSGELSDAPHENYTEEESRLLVRKLDWHVGHRKHFSPHVTTLNSHRYCLLSGGAICSIRSIEITYQMPNQTA